MFNNHQVVGWGGMRWGGGEREIQLVTVGGLGWRGL